MKISTEELLSEICNANIEKAMMIFLLLLMRVSKRDWKQKYARGKYNEKTRLRNKFLKIEIGKIKENMQNDETIASHFLER